MSPADSSICTSSSTPSTACRQALTSTGRAHTRWRPWRPASFETDRAYLCLEQPLGGDAAATIYWLARLDELTRTFGDRGYRLANLEAGLAGGRAYLAAYAQGFGASGLTFYDAHVVEFFSPHAAGKDAIFVTALGRSGVGGRVTIESTLTTRRRPSA